jgi:predicted TIM-barrel fold metal-dependent hydrolase
MLYLTPTDTCQPARKITREEFSMTNVQVKHGPGNDAEPTKSAQVRAQLKHPIIDSDGHIMEFEPAVLDIMETLAGRDIRDRYGKESFKNNSFGSFPRLYSNNSATPEERLKWRIPKTPWWTATFATQTSDRAAAMLPGLLYERLDETGLDFSILYPSAALYAGHLDNQEFRLAGSRAFNQYNAEAVAPYSDRLRAVAIIPMHTPGEAIAELEYAVKVQGFKCIVMPSYIVRPVPGVLQDYPEVAQYTHWHDTYGLDSLYDYDPVWAKCVELGVAPTFHTPGYGFTRASLTNWMANHVGVFAAGGEGITRALFMGGVPHRFPTLRFGVMEGGVGFATTLYSDLIAHWKKRNRNNILKYDPRNLDMTVFRGLFAKYGNAAVLKRLDRLGKSEWAFKADSLAQSAEGDVNSRGLDEFAKCGIERKEDFKDLYAKRFFFGCEADDPINIWAFNDKVNPMRVKLKAILASDIGHFDVTDITEIAEEAYEAVEHGLMSEEDFKAYSFTNPVDLWAAGNPDFFKGTIVEKAVSGYLSKS